MGLGEYKAKRDFSRTKEPAGIHQATQRTERHPLFVVQKHAAARLHYDFRLEMKGVLKSWAIPKGFPTKRGDKRLAIHVEDHPLDYAKFEGTISRGNYGAGTVMVWDIGTYEIAGDNTLHALERGRIHLILSGEKLKGEWTLIRMRDSQNGNKKNWLLLKSGTDASPISALAEDRSAVTGRSMRQIAEANDAQWENNRASARNGGV